MQIDPSLLGQRSVLPAGQSSATMSEAALKRLIDALSPDEALVLHLSVFEGRAPRDIAGALGVSLATVYRRLNAAKTHLTKLLG
jgi:DNA-directed RNA polymerase specialized sigma24 family protein